MKLIVINVYSRTTGTNTGVSTFKKLGEFDSVEASIEAVLSHTEGFRPRFGYAGDGYVIIPVSFVKENSSLRELCSKFYSPLSKEDWRKDQDGTLARARWLRKELERADIPLGNRSSESPDREQ